MSYSTQFRLPNQNKIVKRSTRLTTIIRLNSCLLKIELMTPNESERVDKTEAHKSVGETSKDLQELRALKVQKDKIEQAYRQIFPKVDPYLVHQLYLRMQEDPTYKDVGPMFTVEVFTKEGTDPEASKRHILNTTGMVPAIYDKGTHYVTHMRLTPEILKKLNDFDHVLEIMGDYTGTDASQGPSHSLGDFRKRYQDDSRQKDMS
jgi:hypothetical protein